MNRLTGILALILVVSPAAALAEDMAAPAADPTQVSGTWINGVKGGASWATLGGDTTDDVGTHLGANIGYFFSYRIGNGIAVQPVNSSTSPRSASGSSSCRNSSRLTQRIS